MSIINVTASENMEYVGFTLTMFSQMPMMKAPTTAPGMEPMPPNTAATKARSPGRVPDYGMMDRYLVK